MGGCGAVGRANLAQRVEHAPAQVAVDGRKIKAGTPVFGPRRVSPVVLTAEKAARERTPDQDAQARRPAEGHDLVLDVAAEEGIVHLRRYERRVMLRLLDAEGQG